jgi:pyruvate,water dikinase
MNDLASPQPITLPPDFPVAWERPEDAFSFWERETSHYPGQSPMLDCSLARRAITPGFNAGCEMFSFPVRNRTLRFNTFAYQTFEPISHDPAELEALGKKAQELLGAAIGTQVARWEGERLPEIKELLTRWRAFDLASASDVELLAHFQDTLTWLERAWHIHFFTVFPVLISMSLFDDFYSEVLGGDDTYAVFRLLQGQDNMSLAADRALYALSRDALSSSEVMRVLGSAAPNEVVEQLGTFEDGRTFLAKFDAYLDEYGRRTSMFINVSATSWIEDPSPLLAALQDAVRQPGRDPEAELAALAEERERLTDEARNRLVGFPEAVQGQFEFLLVAARQGTVMQEDHNYWIDTQVMYEVRRVVLEMGRRLVANGGLESTEDVFHLRVEELDELSADLRSIVVERVAELAAFSGVTSPPVIGSLPPGPPPEDPVSRAVIKMFGGHPRESTSPDVFYGMPGSAGVVRGRVRVLRSLADGDALEHGDILVAETTAPPWTPLFARAGAIVTDAGGILSHCAVVAREYGIPAVVGTKQATTVLQDGQLVEVDGTSGSVRIIEA